MPKTVHIGISVRGVLGYEKREFARMFKGVFSDNGRVLTVDEAKAYLLDELSRGHERIPIGDCDAWDFKKGCPGHEMEDQHGN